MKNLFLIIYFSNVSLALFGQCESFILSSESTSISCFGNIDGTIVLSQDGGTGIVTCVFKDSLGGILYSGPDSILESLEKGWYFITVTDEVGCELNDSVFIDEPDSLVIDLIGTNPTCHNFSDGSVIPVITGGSGPGTITMTDAAGLIVYYGGVEWNSLQYGWYYCEVVDENGCAAYDSVYLDNPEEIAPQMVYTQPTSLGSCDGIAEVDTVLSYSGSYSALAYFWSPGGPYGTGETIKNDCCDAFYSLTINDETGCSVVVEFAMGSASLDEVSNELKVELYPNPAVSIQHLSIQPEQPVSGIISLIGSDGKFVQSVYKGVLDSENNDFNIDLSGLPAGIYFYEILVKNGAGYYKKLVKK